MGYIHYTQLLSFNFNEFRPKVPLAQWFVGWRRIGDHMPIGLWTSQLSMLRLGLIYLPHMALALDRFLKINSPILYKSSDTTHRNTYIFDLFMSKNHYLKQKVETCLNSEHFRQTLFMRIHILKDWKYMHHSYLDNVLTQFFLVSIPLQLTTILLFFLQRNQQKCKKCENVYFAVYD